MKNITRIALSFLGAACMGTQLIGAGDVPAFQAGTSIAAFDPAKPATPEQREVEKLLKQVSSNAAIVSEHADRLESFTRGSRLQFETHALEITKVKTAINIIGVDFRRLQELRPNALAWQQSLIDRIEPVLVDLAGHATDAIEQLNEDRGKQPSQDYRDSIINVYTHANQARNLVSVHMDFAESREKLNRLDAEATEPVAIASAAPKSEKSLEQRVKSELLNLPYYGVFDFLAFEVDDDQVTLHGHVSWPSLKTDAERVVREVEGVDAVRSNIEVLPLSPNDDRIRIAAYRAIYGHATLVRYHLDPNPPIRIIVLNGNVTLKGVVGSEMDRTIAHMQANSVPGVFSVTNHLEIGG